MSRYTIFPVAFGLSLVPGRYCRPGYGFVGAGARFRLQRVAYAGLRLSLFDTAGQDKASLLLVNVTACNALLMQAYDCRT